MGNGEAAYNLNFVANKRWFDRFRKCFTSQNLKIPKNDLADIETTKNYSNKLQKVIEQCGIILYYIILLYNNNIL